MNSVYTITGWRMKIQLWSLTTVQVNKIIKYTNSPSFRRFTESIIIIMMMMIIIIICIHLSRPSMEPQLAAILIAECLLLKLFPRDRFIGSKTSIEEY